MLEKLKTVVLALLVALSLVQSYYLGFSKPDPSPMNQPEYVRSEVIGTSLTIDDLLTPKDIVLHFGDDQHTLIYPEEYFFELIVNSLRNVEFDTIQSASIFSLNMERMRQERMGMEIRFHVPVSPGMIRNALQIETEGISTTASEVRFHTIWILKDADDAIRAYLLSDGLAYSVENVDLTMRELERNVTFGQYRTRYTTADGRVYKPTEAITAGHRVQFSYTQYTSEQLRNSLFVDPGISRSIMQRDTEIITDGKRGLEIDHTQHWMNYSDPVAPTDEEVDVDSNLNSALQFVNDNGGWNGAYKLLGLPEGFAQEFSFIQYFESLPIISTDQAKFGTIQVTMTNGLATGYERSIINPEWDTVERSSATLPGGEELDLLLSRYALLEYVTELFPAYEAIISDTSITLEPRWAVKLSDQTFDFIGP